MQSSKFLLGSRVENFTLSFLRVLTSWFQVSLPFEKTMSQSSNAFLFSRPNVEYPSYQKFIFQTAGLRISRFMCTSVGKISLTPSFSTVAPLFAAESHQKSNRSPFFPSRQRSITELPLDSQLWSLLNYFQFKHYFSGPTLTLMSPRDSTHNHPPLLHHQHQSRLHSTSTTLKESTWNWRDESEIWS